MGNRGSKEGYLSFDFMILDLHSIPFIFVSSVNVTTDNCASAE